MKSNVKAKIVKKQETNALLATKDNVSHHKWKFKRNYFQNPENIKNCVDKIGVELGYKQYEDWYQCDNQTLQKLGLYGLLAKFGKSSIKLIIHCYPSYPWKIWKFKTVSRGFWKSKENKKEYFDWLGKELNYKSMSDWYQLQLSDIINHGGSQLIFGYYSGSPYKALLDIYDEYHWEAYRFKYLPKLSWKDDTLLLQFIKKIEQELSISDLSDWYRVSEEQISKIGSFQFIERNGGLYYVLKKIYPTFLWEAPKFSSNSKKSSQRGLIITLKLLFPNREIIEEHNLNTKKEKIEVDAYIPSLYLAFEFNGFHHYSDSNIFGTTSTVHSTIQDRGITLIVVPYWWDKSKQSLSLLINSIRPELKLNTTVDSIE